MATQSGGVWIVSPDVAFNQLFDTYANVIIVSGRRVSHARAEEAEQWMKETAPWEDVTGAARAGLSVEVREAPSILAELVFSHDESLGYPIWLELAHGDRFSIIAPAIDMWGPVLMRDVQRIVNLGLAAK